MFFLVHEDSNYELLKEYIANNFLAPDDISSNSFDNSIYHRGQQLGFRKIEDYCSYVVVLPYRQMLAEIKSFLLTCHPLSFFLNRDHMDSLTFSTVSEILHGFQKESEEKTTHTGWLRKMLSTEIKLRLTPEVLNINILGVESASGEEVYSAAFRLKSILPKEIKIEIESIESDSEMLNEAREAKYHRGKIIKLDDSYRSVFLEKTPDDWFRVSEEIRKLVRFKEFDILTANLNGDKLGRYHLILCNNLCKFYPFAVVKRIIMKVIPLLSPSGVLFASFPGNVKHPFFAGLDIVQMGRTTAYRRNQENYMRIQDHELSRSNDSIENRFFYCKALFLQNRLDEALVEINKILEEQVDSPEANFFKGDIYFKKGLPEKALSCYDKTLTLNPSLLPARFNMAIIHLLRSNRSEALLEIDMVIENLDNFEWTFLRSLFNQGYGNFVKLCQDLRNVIITGDTLVLEQFQDKIQIGKEKKVKVPDLEIPDIFEKKTPQEEEKIDISKEKMEQEYVKHKVQLIQDMEEPAQEIPPAEEVQQEDSLLRSKAQEPTVKGKNVQLLQAPKTKRLPTKIDMPAHAIFLDSIKLEDLKLSRDSIKKMSSELERQAKEGMPRKDEFLEIAPKTAISNQKTQEGFKGEIPEKNGISPEFLPTLFMDSIDELLTKQDIEGIIEIADYLIPRSFGGHRKTLEIIKKICTVFKERTSPQEKEQKIDGKLKEFRDELEKVQSFLDQKNLLQASMTFHKLINIRSQFESMPERQKRRLQKIKEKVKKRAKRYQQFLEKYYTDPKSFYQSELWEILSHLSSPDQLIETGKQYGLDPDKMPEKYRKK